MPSAVPQKKTRERAAFRIARKLVSEIRRRHLRPGAQLFSEHIMVEKYGVARATIREALRFLELQGALRIKAGPGGGPVVSVPGAGHLASVLSLHLQFADASFSSVIDARRSIYPLLAYQAAENARRDDIATLQESIARMHAGVRDLDLFTEEARRFMSLVATASGNRVLAILVDALHRMSEGVGAEWDAKQRRAMLANYEAVIQAIEASEAEQARSIMEKSLAAAARYWERTAPDELKKPVAWIDSDH
ncbi:MAG: FadR family transcriptional regulator [Deltaproteobacteria bacterium]|nr:FadR family transcriptional regulator [Deltaproteobacteria bacterium]MBW2694113.1 FadR family transcriptional regulator [Deltaproteobacteria bacterium]